MRKTCLLIGLFALLCGYALYSCRQADRPPEAVIKQMLLTQIDSLSACLTGQFQVAAQQPRPDQRELQHLFLEARLKYKKFEWAAEYFTPNITRLVNGPPVAEVEAASGRVMDPDGLQMLEQLVYPGFDPVKKPELLRRLRALLSNCQEYRAYFQQADLYSWQVLDAARQEVFRILALGITGFDNPLSLNSQQECMASLAGLQAVLSGYGVQAADKNLNPQFAAAIRYLRANKSFDAFDRATFITAYGNPLSIGISRLQRQLKLPVVKYNRLLNQEAATLFDARAFNVNAYGPGESYLATDKRIELGRRLFFDPRLSGTQTVSCASCHQPDKAFTDGLIRHPAIHGDGLIKRNTPTVINAALQPAQFFDERVSTLEEQVQDVLQNKQEMHGSMPHIIRWLWRDGAYRKLFSNAYPKTDRIAIAPLEVANSLSSYIRSLTQLNSRFDAYMRGNKATLSANEVRGFNLFMGKAKCGTCHYMPLFNGALPPEYIKMDAEVIGVPGDKKRRLVDGDMGRFTIQNYPGFKHAFKTPSLRNAALTAPYMHNGVFASLGEVIDFYNNGGGAGAGLKVANQTLPSTKLHLSNAEKAQLIAFIKAL